MVSSTTLSGVRWDSTGWTERIDETKKIVERIFSGSDSVVVDLEVQLDQLEDVYLLRDSRAVKHFLRRNPELLPPLWDATTYIAEYFGDHALASLRVVTDPEVEGWENLFVVIRTSMPYLYSSFFI